MTMMMIREVISRGLREKIKMLSVTVVANKVTLKGTVDRTFLETMFFLSITHFRMPPLLDYAKGVTKAVLGVRNVAQ